MIDIFSFISGIAVIIIGAYMWDKWQKSRRRRLLKHMLLHEVWMNLNFVSQIEESYKNNIADPASIHIPHYPPRTEIMGKLLDSESIFSLQSRERQIITEIFAQLEGCKTALEEWKRHLMNDPYIAQDKPVYEAVSTTLLSFISPAMQNMLDFWVALVQESNSANFMPQIQKFKHLLREKIREGKWIRTSYKASEFIGSEVLNESKFDVILCWLNDWPDSPKEIIEVQDLLKPHESWSRK